MDWWGVGLEAYQKFDKPKKKKVKIKFLDMVMFNFARQQPPPPLNQMVRNNSTLTT